MFHDDVRIEPSATGKRRLIHAPYHPDFVADIKALGGRWEPNGKRWSVDVRDEERVRELLVTRFGTDGSPQDAADLVTARIALHLFEEGRTAQFAGRTIAVRPYRDSRVKLTPGVVLVAGKLSGSGGSVANPRINADGDVEVELRDIPRTLLQTYSETSYEIVSEQAGAPDGSEEIDRLRTRRAELLAQVREVSLLLADLDPEGEEALQAEAQRKQTETIAAGLKRQYDRAKADAIRELVLDYEQREQERAEQQRHQDEETQAAVLLCRCGRHTCPPQTPTAQEYARTVGRTVNTVLAWCNTGKIPAVKHSGRWYITGTFTS